MEPASKRITISRTAYVIIAFATAAIILLIVFAWRTEPNDTRRLNARFGREARFSKVHVINSDSGRIVMIVAPKEMPDSDRHDLEQAIAEVLHNPFPVTYGFPVLEKTRP